MGGLDLCFGRMDNSKHLLYDDGSGSQEQDYDFFPGIDFSNSRKKDFDNVKRYEVARIDKVKIKFA